MFIINFFQNENVFFILMNKNFIRKNIWLINYFLVLLYSRLFKFEIKNNIKNQKFNFNLWKKKYTYIYYTIIYMPINNSYSHSLNIKIF